jgi:hypothetical protein
VLPPRPLFSFRCTSTRSYLASPHVHSPLLCLCGCVEYQEREKSLYFLEVFDFYKNLLIFDTFPSFCTPKRAWARQLFNGASVCHHIFKGV